ncbi:UNVERIFIED_CONTAM: Vacuolar protein sorting-associated protein 45 [Sesamum angustifolium]|uniref:Vacuolar protein sorting-associated protein 45 n=1 Tax=Sesamum angustifolium TaxID=2727405 RepID=A0AAW2LX34_9LAMI
MVLITAVRDYINRMLHDISGMKVLILDSHTVSIVSVVYSQSELLQKEVFLVELVDSISMSKEPMSHLKAVYFLRPTSQNIHLLRRQLTTLVLESTTSVSIICCTLHDSRSITGNDLTFAVRTSLRFYSMLLLHFSVFSNMLKDTQLHNIADSDEHEIVQQVQEFYADFVAIDAYHFTFNIASNHMYMLPAVVDPSSLQQFCDRVIDGIAAIFLALKRRPVIRYSRTSDIAKRVAQEASKLMYQQESGLFDFRRAEVSPLLLIVDRRDDPVTPLLNQWTYQAMVHELIGIQDNKVDLRNFTKSSKDQELVLILEILTYVNCAEDMAKFVDNYPEYRKMHGNVSKHVTLVTEMSRIVEERKLMLVSQTEQDLACNGGQGAAFEAVTNLLNNEHVSDIDRLRLVMLYALRYEKESPVQLMQLFNKLHPLLPSISLGCLLSLSTLVQFLLKQAGVDRRTGDLYGSRDLFNYALNMARGLKGVENVYTQHQPLLSQIMESVVKGRLRDVDYPYVGNHFQQARPQDVIIFIVGGTTYEEARAVALQNSTNSGIRFILGGSAILNSKRFLKDLEEAQRITRTSANTI